MSSESTELPFNFCGLDRELSDYDAAHVVVLPVPFEGTVSWQAGTARGPDAIIEASRNMETYDERLGCETSAVGIHTIIATQRPSVVQNAEIVDRGYDDIEGKLRALGAEIERVPD